MSLRPMCGRLVVPVRCFPQATATPPRKYYRLSAPCSLYTVPACVNATRHFSGTAFRMTASKIDGTAIAKSIRERLGAKIKERQSVNPRYKPSLKIVQGTYSCRSLSNILNTNTVQSATDQTPAPMCA
jgi:hypothetical protein